VAVTCIIKQFYLSTTLKNCFSFMYVCIKFISGTIIHSCLFYYNIVNKLKKDIFIFMSNWVIQQGIDSVFSNKMKITKVSKFTRCWPKNYQYSSKFAHFCNFHLVSRLRISSTRCYKHFEAFWYLLSFIEYKIRIEILKNTENVQIECNLHFLSSTFPGFRFLDNPVSYQ